MKERKETSNAIRWDRLSQDESEFLHELGITLHPSGLSFTKSPTWDQFSIAFSHVMGLKERSPKRGTHINFAVGDCLNAGEMFFGKTRVRKWLREFLQMMSMREVMLKMAGGLLILIQQVEENVRLCCTTLPSPPLSIEEFFADDPSKRRQTLGQMSNALKASSVFTPEFDERLTRFVRMRNQFIHHLWMDVSRRSDRTLTLPSLDEYNAIHDALHKLAHEADYFDRVFRGSRYHLMIAVHGTGPDPEMDPTPAVRWLRYIDEFRMAVRTSGAAQEPSSES